MKLLQLSSASEFDNIISKGVTLVDFSAPWCAPCRAQEPIIEELAIQYSDKASIGKIDIDKNRKIAKKMNVRSIPTLIIFKNGEEIERLVGLNPLKILAESLEKAI